jgi:hypothetical protein
LREPSNLPAPGIAYKNHFLSTPFVYPTSSRSTARSQYRRKNKKCQALLKNIFLKIKKEGGLVSEPDRGTANKPTPPLASAPTGLPLPPDEGKPPTASRLARRKKELIYA